MKMAAEPDTERWAPKAATRASRRPQLTSSRCRSGRQKEARKGRGDAFNSDTHFRFLWARLRLLAPPLGLLGHVRLFPPVRRTPLGNLRHSPARDPRACSRGRSYTIPRSFVCFRSSRTGFPTANSWRGPRFLFSEASPQDCSPSALTRDGHSIGVCFRIYVDE